MGAPKGVSRLMQRIGRANHAREHVQLVAAIQGDAELARHGLQGIIRRLV